MVVRRHHADASSAAPATTRAAVLREAGGAGIGQWAVLQAAASSPAVEPSPINAGEPNDIERAVAAFAREPNGGLIVVVSAWATVHRGLTLALAAKHRLTAIYPYRYFVAGGGLMSYGADLIDQYRRAAQRSLTPRTGTPLNQNIAANANSHQLHTGTKRNLLRKIWKLD
jgi:hypothetical protein